MDFRELTLIVSSLREFEEEAPFVLRDCMTQSDSVWFRMTQKDPGNPKGQEGHDPNGRAFSGNICKNKRGSSDFKSSVQM